jgi:hypothetical protein
MGRERGRWANTATRKVPQCQAMGKGARTQGAAVRRRTRARARVPGRRAPTLCGVQQQVGAPAGCLQGRGCAVVDLLSWLHCET